MIEGTRPEGPAIPAATLEAPGDALVAEIAALKRTARMLEAKLAALAAHNRGHLKLSGSCCPHLARDNLAIIGSEEAPGG